MKKLFFSMPLLAMLACNNNPEGQAAQTPTAQETAAAAPTGGTTVYEGLIPETLWEDKNVPMTITLDKGAGTFTLSVDYNNELSYEGEKVKDLSDAGSFTIGKDNKWGEILELKGSTTGTSFYKIDGNKIKELDHEKLDYDPHGSELQMK